MGGEQFDAEQQLSPEALEDWVISAAFQKAQRREGQRIDPRQFAGEYLPDVLQKDAEKVQDAEALFAAGQESDAVPQERFGAVLEAILAEQIELSDWLAPGTVSHRASYYDDIFNKVDQVVEVSGPSARHLDLAIDITHGTGASLEEKIFNIREGIERGTLTNVKYFRHGDDPSKVGLRGVPLVVIGVDKPRLVEIAKLWIEGAGGELAAHPVQFEIMEEMQMQLESYRDYAQKNCRPDKRKDLVKLFEKYIAIIKSMREAKKDLEKVADLSYRTDDKVYDGISRAVKTMHQLSSPPLPKRSPLSERTRNPWMYQ